MDVYRIKDWNSLQFEQHDNGRISGPMKWIAVPTKHDGKGFKKIMRHPNATSVYGCWILIAALAAKCSVRGTLADEDGPLTIEDMSLKTDAPESDLAAAIEVLMSVKWIEKVPFTDEMRQSSARLRQTCAKVRSTEQNRTEQYSSVPVPEPDSGASSPLVATGRPSPSGSGRKPGKQPAPSSVFDPWFEHPAHLADPGKVREWLTWQSRQPNAVIREPTADDLSRVIAAAQQAVSEAENPVKMFVTIIGKGRKPKAKYYANQA